MFYCSLLPSSSSEMNWSPSWRWTPSVHLKYCCSSTKLHDVIPVRQVCTNSLGQHECVPCKCRGLTRRRAAVCCLRSFSAASWISFHSPPWGFPGRSVTIRTQSTVQDKGGGSVEGRNSWKEREFGGIWEFIVSTCRSLHSVFPLRDNGLQLCTLYNYGIRV